MPKSQYIASASLQKFGLRKDTLGKVLANLQKEIAQIEGASTKGLVMAAYKIRIETEETAPLTPVDLGNLRASFFVISDADGIQADPVGKSGTFVNWKSGSSSPTPFSKKQYKASELSARHGAVVSAVTNEAKAQKFPTVYLGYSAPYAWWVHEMAEAVNWTREGSDWKWFEKAINRNRKVIVQIVRDYAQV